MNTLDISVVISTYNHPEWLQKVLWSFKYQTFQNFEIVIADDGSETEQKNVLTRLLKQFHFQ